MTCSPFSPSVMEYLRSTASEDWANPSAENDVGYLGRSTLVKSREELADALDCDAGQLTFTSGATESINTVLSAQTLRKLGISTVLSCSTEHSATIASLGALRDQGFTTVLAKVDGNGAIDLDDLRRLSIQYQGALISVLAANNETGVCTELDALRAIAQEGGHKVHVDAVQAWGKSHLSLEDMGADFVSLSGHKIGSLKGVGVLYQKDVKGVAPLIRGGGQERGIRAGTSNLAAIRSLAIAAGDLDPRNLNVVREIRDSFEANLESEIAGVSIHGRQSQRIANTSSVCFAGLDNKELMLSLSRQKIMVSTGSACTSGSEEPSYVISTFAGREMARSTIRFSFPFGQEVRKIDVAGLVKTVGKIVSDLR